MPLGRPTIYKNDHNLGQYKEYDDYYYHYENVPIRKRFRLPKRIRISVLDNLLEGMISIWNGLGE